mmetsp:Transcript_58874/g.140453  ORF Transcript_58874/g.140453 Transcript_58874/m.140453 type:complete len:203 (-) Transcript_58874:1066-1674(-)
MLQQWRQELQRLKNLGPHRNQGLYSEVAILVSADPKPLAEQLDNKTVASAYCNGQHLQGRCPYFSRCGVKLRAQGLHYAWVIRAESRDQCCSGTLPWGTLPEPGRQQHQATFIAVQSQTLQDLGCYFGLNVGLAIQMMHCNPPSCLAIELTTMNQRRANCIADLLIIALEPLSKHLCSDCSFVSDKLDSRRECCFSYPCIAC